VVEERRLIEVTGGIVEVTRGTMSVAEGPAAGDGGLGPTAGGGLKLASVPVTTRLKQGGADAMGGGRL
jgi:hypothetical protein